MRADCHRTGRWLSHWILLAAAQHWCQQNQLHRTSATYCFLLNESNEICELNRFHPLFFGTTNCNWKLQTNSLFYSPIGKKIILTHNLDGANNVVQVSQVCSISSHNMWFTTKIGCFIQNQCVCSKNIYTFSVNKNQFKFMHISEWKLIYPRLGCSLRCPVSIWAILIRMSWP